MATGRRPSCVRRSTMCAVACGAAQLLVAASLALSHHGKHGGAHPQKLHAEGHAQKLHAHGGPRTPHGGAHHLARRLRCVPGGNRTCADATEPAGAAASPRRERGERFRAASGWHALCAAEQEEEEAGRPAAPSHREPPPHREPPRGPCRTHKRLLPNITPIDAAAAALFSVVAALALAGGVGGGGIFVPALTLVLRFKPGAATGLSQALICGGATGALLVNARERHPLADRPLIHYGVAAFLAPAEMAGAQLGVILNQALPPLIILLAMAALLSLLSARTLRRGLAEWARERAEAERFASGGMHAAEEGVGLGLLSEAPPADAPAAAGSGATATGAASSSSSPPPPGAAAAASPPPGELSAAAAASPPPVGTAPPSVPTAWLARLLEGGSAPPGGSVGGGGGTPTARSLAEAEASAPRAELGLLAGVWLALLALLLARGGKGAPSRLGLSPCGPGYWLVTALGVAGLLAASLHAGRRLVAKTSLQRAAGFRFVAGDVVWDGERAGHCLAACLAAGVVAGLMGVGGGLVLGPLMLELAMLPQVSTATTATMVLLTSSSAAAVFLTAGIIPSDYAFGLGLATLVGGFIGKAGVGVLVRRYRCNSLIVLLLAGLIAASMLATTLAGLLDLDAKLRAGRLVASLSLRLPCAGPAR